MSKVNEVSGGAKRLIRKYRGQIKHPEIKAQGMVVDTTLAKLARKLKDSKARKDLQNVNPEENAERIQAHLEKRRVRTRRGIVHEGSGGVKRLLRKSKGITKKLKKNWQDPNFSIGKNRKEWNNNHKRLLRKDAEGLERFSIGKNRDGQGYPDHVGIEEGSGGQAKLSRRSFSLYKRGKSLDANSNRFMDKKMESANREDQDPQKRSNRRLAHFQKRNVKTKGKL